MTDENNIETPNKVEVTEEESPPTGNPGGGSVDQSSELPPDENKAGTSPPQDQEPEPQPPQNSTAENPVDDDDYPSPDINLRDGGPSGANETDGEEAMLAMLDKLPEEESGTSVDNLDFGQVPVGKAEFQHLSEEAPSHEPKNIDLLMDINLPITIELGRTRMSIADILGLGPGSVVELNKLAGEPVDVLVNYKIVAKGEVVVIDENFGVRITQLMTPEERLKLLGEDQ